MKPLLSLLGLLFASSLLFSQTTITGNGTYTFPTPGSFDLVLPTDCTADATYEIWGGGGAGGYTVNANPVTRNAGGGGGGYVTGMMSITAGTYPIVVGAGGIVTNGATTRQDGTDSSAFGAVGGGGRGASNNPGTGGTFSGGTSGSNGGDGGIRSNNTNGHGGGGGGSGPGATAGAPGTNAPGGVGSSGGAGGTPGGGDGGDNGFSGVSGTVGGGGGGKGNGSGVFGGDGGDGQVIVVITNYSCPGLPVELISFNAISTGNEVSITWQTASETDNEGFEVQKSRDGINWDLLEFVAGNGTSFEMNTYQFTDKRPIKGANYYRLKQIDFDGEFEYSSVAAVSIKSDDRVALRSTIVEDKLHLTIDRDNSANATYQVFNYVGQQLQSGILESGNSENEIDISNLGNGAYLVRINIGREVFSNKFIKL